MTRDQLEAIMGPPVSTAADYEGWWAYQWQFDANLDTDGKAYGLQWIDRARKQQLPCSATRNRYTE
jgi:hypothetical protein